MVDLRPHRSGAHERDPRLAGARILIADDDLGIRKSLAELLAGEGCAVETAADGVEALEKVERDDFDVLISDVVMPRMDGYELFTAVRERRPTLPVLMMTAFHYDRDHVIKRSRIEGLEGVIFKKPVDPNRLREKLVEALARRHR
jgi:CheY-like chemotaxis protein